MSVPKRLLPTHKEKELHALKAIRAVRRITFNPSEARPGETLNVYVPKLNENQVLVPNTMALVFDIDLTGGHANNFLVQNVSRALVDKLVVKFSGTTLEDTVGYDIYKIFQDLFLPGEKRDNMVPERIQSEDLCKIRSGSGDKNTSGDDAENKLTEVYGTKYRINLNHQILKDHGVFYPQALYNDLVFEVTLAAANQVVRGSDPAKLKYKLTNIQLEYEMIRDKTLGQEATSAYTDGKEFAYDQKTNGHENKRESQRPKTVNERLAVTFCGAVHCRGKRFGKIHLSRHQENQRHDKRLAEHAVQQWHRKSGHLERGQSLLHERKTQAPAHESEKVLHRQ